MTTLTRSIVAITAAGASAISTVALLPSNAAAAGPPDGSGAPRTLIVDQRTAPRGSRPANGTAARPFATIGQCAAVATPGTTCLIRAGIYRETVQPTASGTAAAPIVFAAAAGEAVVVSGADPVTTWRKLPGRENTGIYRAQIQLGPDRSDSVNPANDDLPANQLFEAGTPQPEAQWPEPGSGDYFTRGRAQITEVVSGSGTPTGTYRVPGLPAGLDDIAGAQIYWTGKWSATNGIVTGVDLTAGTISATQPVSQSYVYPAAGDSANRNFVLTGKRSFLTQPGEWFHDEATGMLDYWPTNGRRPSDIEVKKRNYAFDFTGVSHLAVQGISVTASTIRVREDAGHIRIDRLRASYLTHAQSVQYDQGLWRSNVYGSRRMDSGIQLLGTDSVISNSTINYSSGSGVAVGGQRNRVEDSLITNVDYAGGYGAGVSLGQGVVDATVAGNTIWRTGRDGINANGAPATDVPFVTRVRITGNDISNYGLISSDLGGIYLCCGWAGAWVDSRIDRNIVHDVATNPTGNNVPVAFYLDNDVHGGGATGLLVDHNISYGVANGIFTNRNTGERTGEQISIVNNTSALDGGTATFKTPPASMLVRNNLFLAGMVPSSAPPARFDHNQADAEPGVRFVDEAARDYRLRPDSPARGAGVATPGITAVDAGPVDLGAHEGQPWTAGCGFPACRTPAATVRPG